MAQERVSGVLLHVTSLPSQGGVGDFGPAAYAFVDFLVAAKQRLWQVLPLNPTGYGSSPYSALSAFAGNPLLISLEFLARDGHPYNVRVEQTSGVPSLDVSATRALQRIDTFGPLPPDYSGSNISVEYWFDYSRK